MIDGHHSSILKLVSATSLTSNRSCLQLFSPYDWLLREFFRGEFSRSEGILSLKMHFGMPFFV